MHRTTLLATTAAVGAFLIARYWYRDQQAERLLVVAHCRLVEEKLTNMELMVSAQSRAVVAAAARPPRIPRPQGDTPPWLS